MGYKFNRGNAESFADALKFLIPVTLKKLFLMDNLLKDDNVAKIFTSMSVIETKGLVSFTLV